LRASPFPIPFLRAGLAASERPTPHSSAAECPFPMSDSAISHQNLPRTRCPVTAPPPQRCPPPSVSPTTPPLARRMLCGPLLLMPATSSHLDNWQAATTRTTATAVTALCLGAACHGHSRSSRLVGHAPGPGPRRPAALSGPRACEAVACGPPRQKVLSHGPDSAHERFTLFLFRFYLNTF
jgi:hypothetical protein